MQIANISHRVEGQGIFKPDLKVARDGTCLMCNGTLFHSFEATTPKAQMFLSSFRHFQEKPEQTR